MLDRTLSPAETDDVRDSDLSKKSVPMDKNNRLIDYSPDFERVEFKQIVTVRVSLEELLSVRDFERVEFKQIVTVRG